VGIKKEINKKINNNMAKTSQQEQTRTATIFHLIDTIISVSSTDTVRVLTKYGFGSEFPYGVNPERAKTILTQLYIGDENKFWQIVNEINVDTSKINPTDRTAYQKIANISPNAKGEWFKNFLQKLQGQSTSGGGGSSTSQTSTGAYIAYVAISISIVVIVIYLLRTRV